MVTQKKVPIKIKEQSEQTKPKFASFCGMFAVADGFLYSDFNNVDHMEKGTLISTLEGVSGVYILSIQKNVSPESLLRLESLVLSGVAVLRQSKWERVYFVLDIKAWDAALKVNNLSRDKFEIYLAKDRWEQLDKCTICKEENRNK